MFFDLTIFRELGQNYRNISAWFLVLIKTLKFASEINWPLLIAIQLQDIARLLLLYKESTHHILATALYPSQHISLTFPL